MAIFGYHRLDLADVASCIYATNVIAKLLTYMRKEKNMHLGPNSSGTPLTVCRWGTSGWRLGWRILIVSL